MQQFALWLEANPGFALLFWPVLTATLVWVFRKRTTEEYAAMNPKVAGVLKILGGSGLDPVTVREGIRLLLTPTPPKPPPSSPSNKSYGPTGLVILLALCFESSACTPAQRQAALLLSAEVLRCIVGNQDLPDDRVALVCGVKATQTEAMRDLLSASRAASAQAAAAAAAREQATCIPSERR